MRFHDIKDFGGFTYVNGSAASYGYDGDGMKSRQTSGGNAIFYARSSVLGNVAMEVNAAAGVYRAYVYAGGKLVAQRSYDGQFYWMHQDHLGSGRKMTDAIGAVKYRAELDRRCRAAAIEAWSPALGVVRIPASVRRGWWCGRGRTLLPVAVR